MVDQPSVLVLFEFSLMSTSSLTEKNHAILLFSTLELNMLNSLMPVSSSVLVVVLLFYVNGKHLRSCRDGQLT